MTETYEWTKADLMAGFDASWPSLKEALDQLSAEQMTGLTDAAGWSVKDHLSHLAAWENSVVVLLRGRPRHEGLGIDEELYVNGTEDAVNDAIYQRDHALTVDEARDRLRDIHAQLLAELAPLDDADLNQPMRHFLPDWTGQGDGPPIIAVIHGNSAEHFADHLAWIRTLTSEG